MEIGQNIAVLTPGSALGWTKGVAPCLPIGEKNNTEAVAPVPPTLQVSAPQLPRQENQGTENSPH